ncbi:hypothetical protein SECTIM467_139 [Brevibacillus phage SecTim467]|uniref:Uncharacterized protein n=2 Tax=Jenstvirus jenst TaxID=1982225 RepID=A0A0K2CPC9_9CAUD|nr:hypothetical protein AVV11_gp057 [Brevibacillus phage Jenst]ALA07263.1 hypothetical protein JENST_134 [Brevibacillus phage Jenst]ALA07465.1 hypothetical protein SECTIM467_139 [Brevibacillus phage SecTim467]
MSKYQIDLVGSSVSNWRALKAVIEKQSSLLDEYFYVYREDNAEEAYIFLSDTELTDWLQKKFYDWGHWECDDLDGCMDDIKVWELIPKSQVDSYSNLYGNAKPTSIVADGQRYYRKAKGICLEPMISISLL